MYKVLCMKAGAVWAQTTNLFQQFVVYRCSPLDLQVAATRQRETEQETNEITIQITTKEIKVAKKKKTRTEGSTDRIRTPTGIRKHCWRKKQRIVRPWNIWSRHWWRSCNLPAGYSSLRRGRNWRRLHCWVKCGCSWWHWGADRFWVMVFTGSTKSALSSFYIVGALFLSLCNKITS